MRFPRVRIKALFAFPNINFTIPLICFILSFPALGSGFFLNDYSHIYKLEHASGFYEKLFLYTVTTGSPEALSGSLARGPFPWWTLPDLKISFWRPVSSALMAFEHMLWGIFPEGYHISSLLWYVALVLLLGGFFRYLSTRGVLCLPVAAMAMLIFAVDDVHIMPVTWIANRYCTVSTFFGIIGLWAYLRWREERWKPGVVFSIIAFILALLAGEVAIGFWGYLVGYEIFFGSKGLSPGIFEDSPSDEIDTDSSPDTDKPEVDNKGSENKTSQILFWILSVLFIVYLGFYKWFNYGSYGSDAYLDPFDSPLHFLEKLLFHIPVLLAGLLQGSPTELVSTFPGLKWTVYLSAVIGVCVIALMVWVCREILNKGEIRIILWMILGFLISLIPSVVLPPSNRLLMIPSIGSSVIAALLIIRGWQILKKMPASLSRLWRRVLWTNLILVFLIIPVLIWPLQLSLTRYLLNRSRAVCEAAELEGLNKDGNHRVVVLTAPDGITGFFTGVIREIEYGAPMPYCWWVLSVAPRDHLVTRTGLQQFELEVLDGTFLDTSQEQLFRSTKNPLEKNEQIMLDGASVTVLEISHGRPLRVRFDFDLDSVRGSDELIFLAWIDGRLARIKLPEVGRTIKLFYTPGPFDSPSDD